MSEIYRKYYIHNINEIGKFRLHRSYDKEIESFKGRKACFSTNDTVINYPNNLDAGYETVDGLFFSCPILAGFIEIRGVKYDNDLKVYLIDCLVFSKDYSKYKKTLIRVNSPDHLTDIEEYINFINHFVDDDNDILRLKNEIDNSCIKTLIDSDVIEIIDDLDFHLFECSQSNPGKDNSFWNEYIISGIPEGKYLQKCLERVLKTCYTSFVRIELTEDNVIKVITNFHSAYSPHIGRIDRGKNDSEGIKSLLMIRFLSFYKMKDEIYSKMVNE